MNRIDRTFDHLKRKKEKALVGFVTAGDPMISRSLELISAMCRAGLDVLELGIPFSDPTADGPVIQRSSARALQNRVSVASVMEMAEKIRAFSDMPIILFSYYNPILAYGVQRFHSDAREAGADGLLVVDLPPEESDEMTALWADDALALIRLVAPTTPALRMQRIAKDAAGFLYLVSKTGVTGSSGLDLSETGEQTEILRSVSDLPICVGFGISTADHVRTVASFADGVVIGSAFERLIEENLDSPGLCSIMEEKVRAYKAATKGLFA